MKVKRIRKSIILYLVLCTIGIFSVGFSQWSLESNLNADVSSQAGDVQNYDDIFINNTMTKSFTLTPNGIIENGLITSKGEISCSFDINLDSAYKTGFLSNSNMVIRTRIKSNNASFLGHFVNPKVDISGAVVSEIQYFGSYIQNEITIKSRATSGFLSVIVSYYVEGSLGRFYNSNISLIFSVEAIKK